MPPRAPTQTLPVPAQRCGSQHRLPHIALGCTEPCRAFHACPSYQLALSPPAELANFSSNRRFGFASIRTACSSASGPSIMCRVGKIRNISRKVCMVFDNSRTIRMCPWCNGACKRKMRTSLRPFGRFLNQLGVDHRRHPYRRALLVLQLHHLPVQRKQHLHERHRLHAPIVAAPITVQSRHHSRTCLSASHLPKEKPSTSR